MSTIKPRIHLLGRHADRTPLSYSPYKHIASKYFTYSNSIFYADILILGFSVDIRSHAFLIEKAMAKNPGLKVVVLSEEPLWITKWSEHSTNDAAETLSDKSTGIPYMQLSCLNSKIFDDLPVPYFITTDEKYLARYQTMFWRNAGLSPIDLLDEWRNRPYKFAYIGECREDFNEAEISSPSQEGLPLSAYRTSLAKSIKSNKYILGKGWGEYQLRRQQLPDWHSNKLALLNAKAVYVSAIENTYSKSYITEKPFDALASKSIPIVWAPENSCLHRVISSPIAITVHSMTSAVASDAIDRSNVSEADSKEFIRACEQIASLTLTPQRITDTRRTIISRIAALLMT
jgi:hypothetical protein